MKLRFLSFLLAMILCLSTVALASCDSLQSEEGTKESTTNATPGDSNGNQNETAKDPSDTEAGNPDPEATQGAQETTQEPGNTEQPSEEGYDGSAVTITFYHTMGSNLSDVLNAYIEEFNKLYPNITINHSQVGGYDDVREQISTEITVGNQPNIAYCYPDHVAMYNISKAVVPLDSLIDSLAVVTRADGTQEVMGLSQRQINDFIPGYYNEGKQFGDGKMYTLPLSKSTEVLYYNADFFAEHNLTPPTTWDEMEALCAKIKEIDPLCIPLGYDSESNWFITMCE